MEQNMNIKNMVKELFNGKDIRPEELPDIELYMDQVTTFIDNKLGFLKRSPADKLLTKTMINNYTKSKILLPSNNKKYDKDHMIVLILIYYLKQILSINDIHDLFLPLFKRITAEKDSTTLTVIYSLFLDIKASDYDSFTSDLDSKLELIKSKTQNMKENDKEFAEKLLTVLILIFQAYSQKRLAEKIIDEYFVIPRKTK